MKKLIFSIVLIVIIAFTALFYYNRIYKTSSSMPVRIVVITDRNYVIPVRTLIKSIRANKNSGTKVELVVLSVDLSLDDINKISKEAVKNLNIKVINISSYFIKKFQGGTELNPNVSRVDNLKFFIPRILHEYDKLLYLDADTVVLKDLSKLYNIELGDNYAAVVDDWQTAWYGDKRFTSRYFNNGVMLLNLDKIRADNLDKKLIEIKRGDAINRFVTQDAFNQAMFGKVLYLPLIYNTFAPEYDKGYSKEKVKRRLKSNYDEKAYPYKNTREFRKDVVIIHYCGWSNFKPWQELNFHRVSNRIWYKYAPSEFRLIQIRLLKEKYFAH